MDKAFPSPSTCKFSVSSSRIHSQMPPKKEAPSKKTLQKKKEQAIDDKTFGLKNKNKSKKVQQQIQSIKKTIENSGDPKQRKLDEQRKAAKAAAKALRKAAEDERNALFSEGLLAVSKKSTVTTKALNDAKGRDHDEGKEKGSTSRAMKMMFQMDAKEMEEELMRNPNYVRTIEDDVELQRQKKLEELRASGIKGTPVTPESFAAWKERKQKAKLEAAKKMVEAEFRKKKGGKGLSVLSGRDLYEYKRDLFKDDEDAEGVIERDPVLEEEQDIYRKSDVIQTIAEQVQTELFLDGDDNDLDDLLSESEDDEDMEDDDEDDEDDDTAALPN